MLPLLSFNSNKHYCMDSCSFNMLYFVTDLKNSLLNTEKEWLIRNTDGDLVLATWAEMFDNALDKKEREEAQDKLKRITARNRNTKSRIISLKEHLIVFLLIFICILLLILLPVFWFLSYHVYKYIWG